MAKYLDGKYKLVRKVAFGGLMMTGVSISGMTAGSRIVNELINLVTPDWYETLIRESFGRIDASEIL